MVDIRCEALSAGIAPEVGGSLAYLRQDRGGLPIDLMRPLSDPDRAARDPLGVAMFPMVPYANQIAGNRFTFRNRTYAFRSNNPPDAYNVHGTGWQNPWRVVFATESEAVLELAWDRAGEPYRYTARQRFTLSPEALTVDTRVENAGDAAMPFGFGQHPWFIRDADTTLRFAADAFWIEGTDGIPTERIRTPPELSFSKPTRLPAARRNNCYGLWDGTAEIAWPSRGVGLRIVAEPIFKHVMLYCDPARTAFCVEPQTNLVGAFGATDGQYGDYDANVIVLEPGAAASGRIEFRPFSL